jgi:DNA primase catalytic core
MVIFVNLVEILEQRIYPALDRGMVFSKLNPSDKGSYYLLDCPRCHKREAFIYKDGFSLSCNRLNHCGHSESIIQFVAQGHVVRGTAFVEAVKSLAAMVDVEIPHSEMSATTNEAIRSEERSQQLLEAVVRFARAELLESLGLAYLTTRGLRQTCIENFEIGFLPVHFETRLSEYLQRLDFQKEDIERSGVLADARWEHRIIGPWRKRGGRIVTLWSRSINDHQEPKYLYVKNGKKSCPFGINKTLSKDIILVEGLFDVMSLWQAGVHNVAGLGGALVSSVQLDYLIEHRFKSLTINLDYDPGDRGLSKAKECADKLLNCHLDSYFVNPLLMAENQIDQKMDPDQYIANHPLDDYQKLLSHARRTPEFLATIAIKNVDTNSDASVDRFVDELIDLEAKVDKASREGIWELAEQKLPCSARRDQRRSALVEHQRIKELGGLLKRSMSELATIPLNDTVSALNKKLERFRVGFSPELVEPFSVDACLENIKKAQSGKLTGWSALDDIGIRLMPAELTIVGGRTGHGKTTALFSLLLNWLLNEHEERYLLFSYELPREAICLKLLSTLTRQVSKEAWSYNEIVDYLQGKERYNNFPSIDALERAMVQLRTFESRLHIVYRPSWDVDKLCAYASTQGPLGAILVDYLQLIPPPKERFERRDLEVSLVSRRLKSLSVTLSCPVVAAAQIGRQALADSARIPHDKALNDEVVQNAIKKRRPQLHHLREGGSEQEADLILGLLNYQADFMESREDGAISSDQVTPFEINVIKNRFGRLCIGNMMLEAKCGYIKKKSFRD